MEEIVSDIVCVDGCAHVMCSACFLARLASGLGEVDLIDPFLCPLCKTGSYFARPGANNDDESMKEVHDMRELLWRRCQSEDEEDTPMPAPPGMLPLVVYATYARNAPVIALGRKIADKRKRDNYMSSAICPLGDTASAKRRRKSSCVALGRIHGSIMRRRRQARLILDEAHDLVAALEDEGGEDLPRAGLFIVVVLVRSIPEYIPESITDSITEAASRTVVYIRNTAGQALAEALRAAADPTMCGMSIIRCDDQGLDLPVSEVLVVVPFAESRPTAVAVRAVLRQIRQPQCDQMCASEADALVIAMTEGLEGVSVMPPSSGEA